MQAWIDRTNDGLSGMPADGISLPTKKGDFGTSRWAGSKVRLHQPCDWAEGGMTACGTLLPRTNPAACPQLTKADFCIVIATCVREGQRIAELDAQVDAVQRAGPGGARSQHTTLGPVCIRIDCQETCRARRARRSQHAGRLSSLEASATGTCLRPWLAGSE
jgi:hypothetical protein